MTICLTSPESIGPREITNVQRGIIFMWFIFAFALFVITAVRVVAGAIDPEDEKYE